MYPRRDRIICMKLSFELNFSRKEGFSEEEFIGIISKRLSDLGKEMPIYSSEYQKINGGYIFEIQYKSILPGISYQPILGCFGDLDKVYDFVYNISIPIGRMFQEN